MTCADWISPGDTESQHVYCDLGWGHDGEHRGTDGSEIYEWL